MSNNVIKFRTGEVILVHETENVSEIPHDCPICNNVIRDDHDSLCYMEWGSCSDCCNSEIGLRKKGTASNEE